MRILCAENRFKQGLSALIDDDAAGAASHFRAALDIERQRRVPRPDRRYLSYYGYALARSQRSIEAGVRACREATAGDCRDAEAWLNLGRTLFMANRRRDALDAFETGLSFRPTHTPLRRERDHLAAAMGLRQPGAGRRPRRLLAGLSAFAGMT